MGYVIKPLPKNKRRSWKLQYQSEVGSDRKINDIPEKNMPSIGFSPDMSIEQARERRDQINAQEHLKRHEARRVKIIERLLTEEIEQEAFLPAPLVKEFEAKSLFHRLDTRGAKRNKIASHWRAAKRLLTYLKLPIADWSENAGLFYDYFTLNTFSLSYARKVLAMANRFGSFEARRSKLFFEPVPAPRGQEQQRIADAYFDTNGQGKESDPLTPEMLESKWSKLSHDQASWLFITVWFGLRPSEVDLLLKPSGPSTWYVTKDDSGTDILWVYQNKLKTIAREKRLKGIPVLFPQQVEALSLITTKTLSRPLAKTTRLHFGGKVTLYGGRKNFTDLMLSLGQDFVHVSAWCGHTTVDRTLKSYKNKSIVNYTKPKAA